MVEVDAGYTTALGRIREVRVPAFWGISLISFPETCSCGGCWKAKSKVCQLMCKNTAIWKLSAHVGTELKSDTDHGVSHDSKCSMSGLLSCSSSGQ